jgi:hypothetical protein
MVLFLEIGIVCGSIVLFTAIHAKLMQLVGGKNCNEKAWGTDAYLDPWTSTGLLPEGLGVYSKPPQRPERKYA